MNNNPRLMQLGIKKLGLVRYISLFFDRYFFWTPLLGLMALPFLMILMGFGYVFIYLSWVMMSRTLMTFIICISANRLWSAFYPPLMYYDHVPVGVVKIWSVVSPISNWNRQITTAAVNTGKRWQILSFALVIIFIITVIGLFSGVLRMPGLQDIHSTIKLFS